MVAPKSKRYYFHSRYIVLNKTLCSLREGFNKKKKSVGFSQGCAKTLVFNQKHSPVGLTGLNRVLMGFMGKTGENSNSLCRIRIKETNLENQKIILHRIDN